MTNQRRDDGSLRHLVTLEGLSRGELEALLEHAQRYVRPIGASAPTGQSLAGLTVATLFTEASTRTRVSFELAARRLGAAVVNVDPQLSSRGKGESMLDTVRTLEAMHVTGFVIRDAEPGLIPHLAAHVAGHVSVLSGGAFMKMDWSTRLALRVLFFAARMNVWARRRTGRPVESRLEW
jgi:aspartate carbamoyltransferase catalytic subunit